MSSAADIRAWVEKADEDCERLTEHYGLHALEMVQALAEQPPGGETGIQAVQTYAGEAVWRAFDEKAFDPELFDAAWQRLFQKQNAGRRPCQTG